MTTVIPLRNFKTMHEDLQRHLAENPDARCLTIAYQSRDSQWRAVQLDPLEGRDLDYLDLSQLAEIQDVQKVTAKRIVFSMAHLMNGSAFETLQRPDQFVPEAIEIHTAHHGLNFGGRTGKHPLSEEQIGEILRLRKELSRLNPDGVVVVSWKLQDTGRGGGYYGDHDDIHFYTHRIGADVLLYNERYQDYMNRDP